MSVWLFYLPLLPGEAGVADMEGGEQVRVSCGTREGAGRRIRQAGRAAGNAAMHITYMQHTCDIHVMLQCTLHVCHMYAAYMYVACMLHACRMYAACMLYVCRMRAQWMLYA